MRPIPERTTDARGLTYACWTCGHTLIVHEWPDDPVDGHYHGYHLGACRACKCGLFALKSDLRKAG